MVNKFLQKLVVCLLGAVKHNRVILLLKEPIPRKCLSHLNLRILHTGSLKDKLLRFSSLVFRLGHEQYFDRLQGPGINFHFNY